MQATIALEDVWLKGTQGTVKDRIRCVAEGDEAEKDSELSTVQQIYAVNNEPIQVKVTVDEAWLTMEVDTGASVFLVSEATYRQFWPDQKLEEITGKLTTYTGEPLNVLRKWDAIVCYGRQTMKLPLAVLVQPEPSLLRERLVTGAKVGLEIAIQNREACVI